MCTDETTKRLACSSATLPCVHQQLSCWSSLAEHYGRKMITTASRIRKVQHNIRVLTYCAWPRSAKYHQNFNYLQIFDVDELLSTSTCFPCHYELSCCTDILGCYSHVVFSLQRIHVAWMFQLTDVISTWLSTDMRYATRWPLTGHSFVSR